MEQVPIQSFSHFLTDNLLYVVYSYDEKYLWDRTTNVMYPIQRFVYSHPGSYVNGDADPAKLATALREAKLVFFRDHDDTIIALAPDFPTSAGKNFAIDRFGIPGKNPDRTVHFSIKYNIDYQTISAAFPEEAVSPDSRFVARPDGIYLTETGQRIIEGPVISRFYRLHSGKYFDVRGWTYDGRAVIYSEQFNPCLIETALITIDPACFIKVHQPVLLFKVPEEYLSSTETP